MEKKPVKFVPTGGDPHNSIASLLKVLAFVTFIGGFFGGIAVGDTVVPLADLLRNKADEFQFGYALAVWFSAFVLGALLLGASDLLSILQLHQTQSYIPCEYDPETDAPQEDASATPADAKPAASDAAASAAAIASPPPVALATCTLGQATRAVCPSRSAAYRPSAPREM